MTEPTFNNLFEAEAYYKEEAQAKAENREADHSPKPESDAPHENTVFNPSDSVTPIHSDTSNIAESASPTSAYEAEVTEGYDPSELTPIYQEPVEEPIEEPEPDLTATPVAAPDTPQE